MPIVVDGQNEGEVSMPFPEHMESGNLQVALSTLGQGAAAAGQRRTDRADQLSGDSQASWTIAMQNPTNLMAKALQGMYESGSGRTRAETNNPGNTSAPYVPPLAVNIEKQA
jgi:hypothetical protein